MNAQQEELDHPSGCDVYIVVHEGTEVGRVLREAGPSGDRWRIETDALEGTYDRVEDAARACIEYARGSDRAPDPRLIPDGDAGGISMSAVETPRGLGAGPEPASMLRARSPSHHAGTEEH